MENLILLNPDIIIILAPYIKEKNISKQSLISPWLKLPINAKKYHNIFVIDKEYAGISSDRLQFFLKDFKNILEWSKENEN